MADVSTLTNLVVRAYVGAASLFEDAAKTNPAVSPGDPVRALTELANAYDFFAPDDASRPALGVDSGVSYLEVDGGDYLVAQTPAPPAFTAYHNWVWVRKASATSDSCSLYRWWSLGIAYAGDSEGYSGRHRSTGADIGYASGVPASGGWDCVQQWWDGTDLFVQVNDNAPVQYLSGPVTDISGDFSDVVGVAGVAILPTLAFDPAKSGWQLASWGTRSVAPTLADRNTVYEAGPTGSAADRGPVAGLVGCKLWLAADDITGLSDGDPVATWADSSGYGRDAVQATGGIQPTYQTGELNGLPVVRFDGVDDLLDLASSLTVAAFTALAVYRANSATRLVHYLIAGAGADGGLLTGGSAVGGWGAYDGNVSGQLLTANVAPTVPFLASADNSHLWRDGVEESYSLTGSLIGMNLLRVGNRTDQSFLFDGDLAELIVYDSVLSSGDRAAVEVYLTAKWFGGGPPPTFNAAWARGSNVVLSPGAF